MEGQKQVVEMAFDVAINPSQVKITGSLQELHNFVVYVSNSYVAIPITDSNVALAKKELAKFRKVKSSVTDKLRSIKKELMKPFDDFKAKVDNELQALDYIEAEMNKGIKEVEEKAQALKHDSNLKLLESMRVDLNAEVVNLVGDYYDTRWDLKSVTIPEIKTDYVKRIEMAKAVFNLIKNSPYYSQLVPVFQSTGEYSSVELALNRIIENERRLAEAKAKAEAQKQAQAPAPVVEAPKVEQVDSELLYAQFILCGTKDQIFDVIQEAKKRGVLVKRTTNVEKATEAFLERMCKV